METKKTLHEDITHQLMTLMVFSTLCYARFRFDCRRMSVVDCGHTSVIHYHAGSRSCLLIDREMTVRADVYRESLAVTVFHSVELFDVESIGPPSSMDR